MRHVKLRGKKFMTKRLMDIILQTKAKIWCIVGAINRRQACVVCLLWGGMMKSKN